MLNNDFQLNLVNFIGVAGLATPVAACSSAPNFRYHLCVKHLKYSSIGFSPFKVIVSYILGIILKDLFI
jgi:hypothetical protein